MAARLTDAPETDASQARDAVRTAVTAADPDAAAFAGALADYYDDQICGLVARLEAEELPLLAQISSEAFSSRIITIVRAIERHTAALADDERQPNEGHSGSDLTGRPIRRRRYLPIPDQGRWLAAVVRGHQAYYAVPGNNDAVNAFRHQATRHWHQALRRRSQKTRLTWARMDRIATRWLSQTRILHLFPEARFAATHPR